jgi:nucleoside triphosphate pyrophosphatase
MPHTTPFVPWPADEKLILASVSPRRAELLVVAGVPHLVVPANHEAETEAAAAMRSDLLNGKLSQSVYAEEIAAAKAGAVARDHPGALVLGADTIVILDGQIMEKPADAAEAATMLGRLAGRTHQVVSAIALMREADGTDWRGHERTTVEFLPLTADVITDYVATGEPMDKAGAYGIQGLGAMMIRRIDGCYFNVMGLPLALLGGALREILGEDR